MIVLLAGPPLSGKTTVGSILAERLGVPFVDIDELVQDKEGLSVKEIFSRRGEARFRRLETELLRSSLDSESAVVAVGGGCLLSPENLQLAVERAVVFTLTADEASIASRWRGGERPLAATRSDLSDLLSRRRNHYESLPNPVQTDALSPDQVADVIMGLLREMNV